MLCDNEFKFSDKFLFKGMSQINVCCSYMHVLMTKLFLIIVSHRTNSNKSFYFFRAGIEARFHNNLLKLKFTHSIVLQNLLQKDNCKDHSEVMNI